MKKIVYFIGAGFSVPAGLPVISNFLFRARDQYFSDQDRFSYFNGVFNYIDGLSRAKNYTNVDLFNVEEVFSVADTHELLGKGLKKDLEQFIKDVILFHTPEFQKSPNTFNTKKNSFEILLGDSDISKKYVSFFASLLDIKFQGEGKEQYSYGDIKAIRGESNNEYKIVSLNYDNIVENSVEFINANFDGAFEMPLAKLHGSVDRRIIPPTWNKRIDNGLDSDWRNAALWLSEANEIRILGYSLPKTDMYIKHLFSTSLLESKNLQKIDVICLDGDRQVESRYKEMFTFPKFDFHNMNINIYLSHFSGRGYSHSPFKTTYIDSELAHLNAVA
jgi:hypothetical protein